MTRVAIKGLLGRKLRALLTALADRARRRDDQRHLRPHRHDPEGVHHSSTPPTTRPAPSITGKEVVKDSLHRHATVPAVAAGARSARCPTSRPRRATSTSRTTLAKLIGARRQGLGGSNAEGVGFGIDPASRASARSR